MQMQTQTANEEAKAKQQQQQQQKQKQQSIEWTSKHLVRAGAGQEEQWSMNVPADE